MIDGVQFPPVFASYGTEAVQAGRVYYSRSNKALS